MFRRSKPRVPIYKQAACLGEQCPAYNGTGCESRLELLEATGRSGGTDRGPEVEDCSFALYGRVCMGGAEQVVVERIAESPNGHASAMEMVGRMARTDGTRIVLTTPPEAVKFD